MYNIGTVKRQLVEDEGLRLEPYLDSLGHRTVGVGHNLDANPLTEEQEVKRKLYGPYRLRKFYMWLLDEDLKMVEQDLDTTFPWWIRTPDEVQEALVLWCFQLGSVRMTQFAPTLEHIKKGDYEEACKHLEQSLWFKETPRRVRVVENLLLSALRASRSTASAIRVR